MGGDENGQVAGAAQVAEHLPDSDAGDGIEAGGWLVEKENAGIVDQAAGDLDAAAHSAGEGLGLRAAPFDAGPQLQGLQLMFFSRSALGTE